MPHDNEVFYPPQNNAEADQVDGVRSRRASMTIDERRQHLRRMQSMGSLCNTPVMYSLTNRVTSVAKALEAMKVSFIAYRYLSVQRNTYRTYSS